MDSSRNASCRQLFKDLISFHFSPNIYISNTFICF